MNLPSDTPKLPKWIFAAGDAALLLTAWFVASESARPLTGMPLIAIIVLAVSGVALSAYPFIADYARRQDEALDNRQRALQALAATVASSAEQIAIAASGLDRLAGIAQENFNQSDRAAHQIQEKMAELTGRLAEAKKDDVEAAARLESVAKKIAKIVSDLEAAASRAPAPAPEPPQVPASQIVEMRPAVSTSVSPFPPPADEPEPAPATVHEAAPAPRKRAPRKPAPAAEAAGDLVLEAPTAGAAAPVPAAPEIAEPSTTADGSTRLVVTAYIGIGNRLFIRGSGPGLSWDKGVPLTFVSIGKWRWETGDASEAVTFKLYKNDEIECTVLGERSVKPGAQENLTASF